MERESNPMEALCRSGCGFYGNPATDGLCSVCFKEALKKKQQPPQSAPSPSATAFVPASGAAPLPALGGSPLATSPATTLATTLATPLAAAAPTVPARLHSAPCDDKADDDGGAGASTSAGNSDNDDDKEKKKKVNRCAVCRKKVGLTGFECRCGGLFCAVHRYSDKHECSFDYRELGAQEIRRNNPVVVSQKIDKI